MCRTVLITEVSRSHLDRTVAAWGGLSVIAIADTQRDGLSVLLHYPTAWRLAIVDFALRQGNGLHILGALWKRDAQRKIVVVGHDLSATIRHRGYDIGADAVFDLTHENKALRAYCSALALPAPIGDAAAASSVPSFIPAPFHQPQLLE